MESKLAEICPDWEWFHSIMGIIAVSGNNIEELWVQPECHRQGIGTALFNHAQQSVRKEGCAQLTVSTTGYGIPFYEEPFAL